MALLRRIAGITCGLAMVAGVATARADDPAPYSPAALAKRKVSTLALLSAMALSPEIRREWDNYQRTGHSKDFETLSRKFAEALGHSIVATADSSGVWVRVAGAEAISLGGLVDRRANAWAERRYPLPKQRAARFLVREFAGYWNFLGWEGLGGAHDAVLEVGARLADQTKDARLKANVKRMRSATAILGDPQLLALYGSLLEKAMTEDAGLRGILSGAFERWMSVDLLATYAFLRAGGGATGWMAQRALNALAGARAGRAAGAVGALAGSFAGLFALEIPEVGEGLHAVSSALGTYRRHTLQETSQLEAETFAGYSSRGDSYDQYVWDKLQEDLFQVAEHGADASNLSCQHLENAEKARAQLVRWEIEDLLGEIQPRASELIEAIEFDKERDFLTKLKDGDGYTQARLEAVLDGLIQFNWLKKDALADTSSWPTRRAMHYEYDPTLPRSDSLSQKEVAAMYDARLDELWDELRPLGLSEEHTLGKNGEPMKTSDYLLQVTTEQAASLPRTGAHNQLLLERSMQKELAREATQQKAGKLDRSQKMRLMQSFARERLKDLKPREAALKARLQAVTAKLAERARTIRERQLLHAQNLETCIAAVFQPEHPCYRDQDRSELVTRIRKQKDDAYRVLAIMERVLDWRRAGTGDLRRDWEVGTYFNFLHLMVNRPVETEGDLVDLYVDQQKAVATKRLGEVTSEEEFQSQWAARDLAGRTEAKLLKEDPSYASRPEDLEQKISETCQNEDAWVELFNSGYHLTSRISAIQAEGDKLSARNPLAELERAIR